MNIAKAGTLVAGVLALTTPAMGDNPCLDAGGGGERQAQWLYDSPLCVEETITDVGSGMYEYSYAFVNVDTAHIWHFGVWSNFAAVTTSATWDTHPQWSHATLDVGAAAPPYDGRNLDPGILWAGATWGPNWPNTMLPKLTLTRQVTVEKLLRSMVSGRPGVVRWIVTIPSRIASIGNTGPKGMTEKAQSAVVIARAGARTKVGL